MDTSVGDCETCGTKTRDLGSIPWSPRVHTVEVPDSTYEALCRLAGDGPIDPLLVEAVEDLRRKRMLDDSNNAFAKLEGDPGASKSLREEREDWDRTSSDGLEGA